MRVSYVGVNRPYLPDFILFSITVFLNARLAIPKLAGAMLFPLARDLEVKAILRRFHCFHNRLLGISSVVEAVLFRISLASVVGVSSDCSFAFNSLSLSSS